MKGLNETKEITVLTTKELLRLTVEELDNLKELVKEYDSRIFYARGVVQRMDEEAKEEDKHGEKHD